MTRLLSSTIARVVMAIFVLQLATSGAAMWLLHRQMLGITRSERAQSVVDVRDVLLASYRDEGLAGIRVLLANRRKSNTDPLTFIALEGPQGKTAVNIADVPDQIPGKWPTDVLVRHVAASPPVPALAVSTRLDGGYRLVVGTLSTTEQGLDLAFAEAVGLSLAVTAVLATASALGLGLYISRRTHAIAETAEALAAGNFAARVKHEDSSDGFDHLRRQINLMAERITGLLQQLGTVSAALAHDLRSPVARLRASIETAMARTDDPATVEALQMARNDADVLQRMLAATLELNRLESGAVIDRRVPINVGEVAADLVELYEPLAESQGIRLTCEAVAVRALADRELLSRAIANLIDNAIKYGGKTIVVRCLQDGEWMKIGVEDDGPGIAEADFERATARYARLDNARTLPGAGLGLAMASAVAQLHGGTLELSSEGGPGRNGLRATLRMPLGLPRA